MSFIRFVGAVALASIVASPACAQAVPFAPAAADFGLLGIGVAGLLLGRRGSRSKD